MTQRSAFVLHVRPDKIDEYVEAHRAVWPEMLARTPRRRDPQLHDLPRRNEMFGYFEADDLDAAAALPRRRRRSARRWQDAMAELLEERVPDAGPLRRSRRSSVSTDHLRLHLARIAGLGAAADGESTAYIGRQAVS